MPALQRLLDHLVQVDAWVAMAVTETEDLKAKEENRALEIDHFERELTHFVQDVQQARDRLSAFRAEVKCFKDDVSPDE